MVLSNKRVVYGFAAALAAVSLAGCGETRTDRALSGAGIGAGLGAAGSAITGGSPLAGAAIGGVAGGAAGGLTDKDDINLGTPIWRR
jgi:osmotically inducible lipoprotein OsmB